ncbi:MAG: InlB B-repeat-containing protein [Clostridia bacterium]|nr:InlB B-repeat-containing protein [Clostridia bacterium]
MKVKSKLITIACVLAATIFAVAAWCMSGFGAFAEESEDTYTLIVYGATVQISDGDGYVDLEPTFAEGAGRDAVYEYEIPAGASLKAHAVENEPGVKAIFVDWDVRFVNNRANQPGDTVYEFEMPEEDIQLWAVYSTENIQTLGIETVKLDNNAGKENALKEYTGNSFTRAPKVWGYKQIANGVVDGSAEADSDLFKMSGKRISIPSTTPDYCYNRVCGSNFDTSKGKQVIFYTVKNNSTAWTINVTMYAESYTFMCSAASFELKPGETKQITVLNDIGCARTTYGLFAVNTITGDGVKSDSDLIDVDIVGMIGEAYPDGDPEIVPPGGSNMVKLGSFTGLNSDKFKHNSDYAFTTIATHAGVNATATIDKSSVGYPTQDGFDIYYKFTAKTNATADSVTIAVEAGGVQIGVADLTGNEGTTFSKITCTGWNGTDALTLRIKNTQGNVVMLLQCAFNSAFVKEVSGVGEQDGYTITPVEGQKNPVPYAENFSFTLRLDDAHNKSKVTVKANDKVIRPSHGVYTIYNVTEPIAIAVDGVVINKYTVANATGGLGGLGYTIDIKGEQSNLVEHGGSFKFGISVFEGFSPVSKVSYSMGGGAEVQLSEVNNEYTIDNITGDVVVKIEGVDADGNVVKGLKGTGYTAEAVTQGVTIYGDGSALIAVGADVEFSFKIVIKDGYEAKNGLTVKVGDQTLAPDGEVYKVTGAMVVDRFINVVVAGITAKEYSIAYELPAGAVIAGEVVPVDKYTVVDEIDLPENVERKGYDFIGWCDNAELSGDTINVIGPGRTGNITLYPKFSAKSYSLTLNTKGGQWADGYIVPAEYTADGMALPGADKISLAGYVFDGWYRGSTKYENIAQGTTDPLALEAKWMLENYSITYSLNGGAWTDGFTPTAAYTVEDSVTLPVAANAVRRGYEFAGWSSNENLSGTIVGIQAGSTGDRTVYAKWKKIAYSISYSGLNGVKYDGVTEYFIDTAEFTVAKPFKPGFRFAGWKVNGDDTPVAELKISGEDARNYALEATWTEAVYTIAYIDAGTHNNPASYKYGTTDIAISAPTKDGCEFVGWVSKFSSTPVKNFVIFAGTATDLELTAVWKKTEGGSEFETKDVFSVTFAPNGGSAVATQYVTEGNKAVKPADPTWEGMVFGGWYTDAACTEAFDFDKAIDGNTVVYAKWTASDGGCNGVISSRSAVAIVIALLIVALLVTATFKKRQNN